MTFAERFKVRTWLEEPAKWLSWAIDAGANLKDATYNLQQFWKTLEPAKSGNRSSQQWGEILLLDSRAQSTLGHIHLLQAAQQAKTAAVVSVDTAWGRAFSLGPLAVATALPAVREFLAKNDPALKGYQASIRQLYDQAQAAFKRSEDMAAQSKRALAQAQVDATMANRAQSMAQTGQTITQNAQSQTAAWVEDIATNAGPMAAITKAVSMPVFGIPLWGWAAGLAVVFLAVSAGPTVVAVDRARRMTE